MSQIVAVERDASFLRQLAFTLSSQNLLLTVSVLFLPPLLLYVAVVGALFIGRWVVAGFRSSS